MMITKEDVEKFYEEFFNNQNVSAADKIIANNYIQHNPDIENGREALKKAFEKKFLSKQYFKLAIDRIIMDEEFVAVFIRNIDESGATKFFVVDLYRVENNFFAEHWDYFDYEANK